MTPNSQARRWKCVCAYDGTDYSGWQSQSGGNSVQDVIEACLARILESPIRIHGSGRTDAGVHARGQVFHFDAAWRHGPRKLEAAFRAGLPPAIQVKSARLAAPDFHARFGAKGKIYTYDFHLGDADPFERPYCWPILKPMDVEAMTAAAAVLRGRHDFTPYSAVGSSAREDPVRELRRLDLAKRGRRLRLTAEADGFLYKMVRSLAGAIAAAGEGRVSPARLDEILQSRRRTPEIVTAPPQGLCLQRVLY